MSTDFAEQAYSANANRRIGKDGASQTPNEDADEKLSPPTKGGLQPYTIRLYEEQKNRLDRHFQKKGIPPGVGVRSILLEWMERHGI